MLQLMLAEQSTENIIGTKKMIPTLNRLGIYAAHLFSRYSIWPYFKDIITDNILDKSCRLAFDIYDNRALPLGTKSFLENLVITFRNKVENGKKVYKRKDITTG